MFELLGWTWVADDAAAAVWSVEASCCDDWTPPAAGADCVAACVVGAAFAAVPADAASFDCVEAGAGAGAAVAGADADCAPAACIAPARTSSIRPDCRQPHPDASVWFAFCGVAAVFAAVADEDASLDCETEPSSPGLSTRTETFWFDGCTWVALDAAMAPWSVDDDCVAACTGSDANALPAIAANTASVAASVMIHRFIEDLLGIAWYRAR
jgi:hypothetical protein